MANLFGNGTATPVAWQAQPTTRGTWGILSACLATLLLCTWTAVHLNLPAPGKATNQKWRKLGWMIAGLLAPEMVAFTAWTQHRSSKKLFRDMRKALGQPPPLTMWQRVKAWVSETCISIRQAPYSMVRWCSKTSTLLLGLFRNLAPWPIEMSAYGDEGKIMVDTYQLAEVEETEPDIPHGDPDVAEADRYTANNVLVCEWTETHSWFAVMGGFVVDMRDLPQDFVPGSPKSQTLSTHGLLLLARCKPDLIRKLLRTLSADDILDKGKADGLKKLLICVQASWFLVSTVFRLARGYSIALLELDTLAHALCALLVYLIWWSKPLDVTIPTVVDGGECDDVVAFLAMASNYSGRRELDLLHYYPTTTTPQQLHAALPVGSNIYPRRFLEPRVRFDPGTCLGNPWGSSVSFDRTNEASVHARLSVPRSNPGQHHQSCQLPGAYRVLQMSQTLYGFCFEIKKRQHSWQQPFAKQRPYIVLREADLMRWRRASEVVEAFLKFKEAEQFYINFNGDSADPELSPDRVPDLLVDRIQNWPADILSVTELRRRDFPTYVAFLLAGWSYGGIHLVATAAPFYGRVERILWLVSSITLIVASSGVIMIIYLFTLPYTVLQSLDHFTTRFWILIYQPTGAEFYNRMVKYQLRNFRIFNALFMMVGPLGLTAILLSRTCLIVECFLNLFRLDPTVFAIPSWVAYFPHLS